MVGAMKDWLKLLLWLVGYVALFELTLWCGT